MSYKDRLAEWVEEQKYEHNDGTFSICDPFTGEREKEVYTEEEIDAILWDRACELDGTELYGVDA